MTAPESPRLPFERILSFAEYGRLRHPTPYLVDVEIASPGTGRLVLFGARHTSDPRDPMFDAIDAAFSSLGPAFALHEGTPPHVEAEREVAIRRHGEAGFLRHLAARAGIDCESLDVPLEAEAGVLAARFGSADALVFLVVRQLASFNRKTARMDFAAYFREFFARIEPALALGPIGWAAIDVEHRRLLGAPLVPRAVTSEWTDPTRDRVATQRIAAISNRLRDEHILARLVEATARHGRVLATVGVSHAVMLEPALRAALAG